MCSIYYGVISCDIVSAINIRSWFCYEFKDWYKWLMERYNWCQIVGQEVKKESKVVN